MSFNFLDDICYFIEAYNLNDYSKNELLAIGEYLFDYMCRFDDENSIFDYVKKSNIYVCKPTDLLSFLDWIEKEVTYDYITYICQESDYVVIDCT